MSKKTFIISLFVGFAALASSCGNKDKDDDTNRNGKNPANIKSCTVDATSFATWSYFSFEEGKVVEVSDYAHDETWDMGFHRTDVRLNGGASGKGRGAGLETTTTKLSDITSVPSEGFVEDVMNDEIVVAMPPKYETQPMNEEISKWASLDMSSMPPIVSLSGKVYIVRTAKGKYAKVKFIDFTNDKGKNGYVTFQYIYPFE